MLKERIDKVINRMTLKDKDILLHKNSECIVCGNDIFETDKHINVILSNNKMTCSLCGTEYTFNNDNPNLELTHVGVSIFYYCRRMAYTSALSNNLIKSKELIKEKTKKSRDTISSIPELKIFKRKRFGL